MYEVCYGTWDWANSSDHEESNVATTARASIPAGRMHRPELAPSVHTRAYQSNHA